MIQSVRLLGLMIDLLMSLINNGTQLFVSSMFIFDIQHTHWRRVYFMQAAGGHLQPTSMLRFVFFHKFSNTFPCHWLAFPKTSFLSESAFEWVIINDDYQNVSKFSTLVRRKRYDPCGKRLKNEAMLLRAACHVRINRSGNKNSTRRDIFTAAVGVVYDQHV